MTGWKTMNKFFYNEFRAVEKHWNKCISVAGNCVEK